MKLKSSDYVKLFARSQCLFKLLNNPRMTTAKNIDLSLPKKYLHIMSELN